jgi:hypothetical protein
MDVSWCMTEPGFRLSEDYFMKPSVERHRDGETVMEDDDDRWIIGSVFVPCSRDNILPSPSAFRA